jgi:hypothetical protein
LTTSLTEAEESPALAAVRDGWLGVAAGGAACRARPRQDHATSPAAMAETAPSQRRRWDEDVVLKRSGFIGGTRSSWLGLG